MSIEKINALFAEAGEAHTAMRSILDTASTENRELTKEENDRWEKFNDQYDAKMELRAKEQKTLDRSKQLENDTELAVILGQPGDDGNRAKESKTNDREKAHLEAFRSYLIHGDRAPLESLRALQADNDTTGGYLVPPSFALQLIAAIKNMSYIRGLANVLPPLANGTNLGVPTLDNDLLAAAWTPEISAVPEDTNMSFGRREFKINQVSKLVKVSNKLLRTSGIGVEPLILDRLAYQFNLTEENVFLTGDGVMKPLGLFVAHNDGIPTNRDVSSGNTTTAMVPDNVLDTFYSLKEGYQKNATWLLHRLVVKMIRKMKTTTNEYLWQAALSGGNPATICDRPYVTSELAPSTFTTGQYLGIVGDFKQYWIADGIGISVQYLNELFALTNQRGYIGRKEVDGQPVMGEAFARIQLA